jgi:hypothetical protein
MSNALTFDELTLNELVMISSIADVTIDGDMRIVVVHDKLSSERANRAQKPKVVR